MRARDIERLSQAYADTGLAPDRRLAPSLSVNIAALYQPHDEMTADLDPERLGIGWWAPHPGRLRHSIT